jgi:hypothetical protein
VLRTSGQHKPFLLLVSTRGWISIGWPHAPHENNILLCSFDAQELRAAGLTCPFCSPPFHMSVHLLLYVSQSNELLSPLSAAAAAALVVPPAAAAVAVMGPVCWRCVNLEKGCGWLNCVLWLSLSGRQLLLQQLRKGVVRAALDAATAADLEWM